MLRVDFIRDEDIEDALSLFEEIIDDNNVGAMAGYMADIADFIVSSGSREQIKRLNLLDERIHHLSNS